MHENLNTPNLPDGKANNARLMQYAGAAEVAAAKYKLPYVDLFHVTKHLYMMNKEPLTLNGIHPNSRGNQLIAQHLVKEVFGLEVSKDTKKVESIREAVLDKNWHWHTATAPPMVMTFGEAALASEFVDGQSSNDVLMHELDMIDVMVANRDRKVWATPMATLSLKWMIPMYLSRSA